MAKDRFTGKEELLSYVQQFLIDNCDNIDLIKYLNQSFSDKGLMAKIPSLIMDVDSHVNVYNINSIELITLVDNLYSFTKNKILNPEYYFSDLELDNYENYKAIPSDVINSIVLKNGIKISEEQWVFYVTLKDCYLMNKNMMVRYNIQTQRKANYKEIGTKGFGINEISLDDNAVQSIKEEFKNGDFTPNLITFNILVQDDKIAQVKPEGNDLIITPNYNRKSNNTTYVDCIDGYHRFTGACLAYKEALEEGRELDGGLLLSVVRMTTEEARKYIIREFKRSSTSTEWLKSIEEDDYTKMADRITKNIKLSRIGMSDFVGLLHEDIKQKGKITTRNIIADALKHCKISVNNLNVVVSDSNKIADFITLLLGFLADNYFDSDYKKMLKESYLLDCNMFFMYVVLANNLKKEEDLELKVLELAEKLYELNNNKEELRQNLMLKNKNYSMSKIIEFINKELIEQEVR